MGTGYTSGGVRCRLCQGQPDRVARCICTGAATKSPLMPRAHGRVSDEALAASVSAELAADGAAAPQPQTWVKDLRRDGSVYRAEGETFRIRIGTAPSNTRTGSMEALSNVYAEVTLGPDDQVMDLPGGMFVAIADSGVMYRARYLEPERHMFERGGNPDGIPHTAERARRPSRPEDWDLHEEYFYDDMTVGEGWGAMDRVIKDD